jgi:crotonobetainyl-CoA:carnitine CoA-transferase CaiB-like acyl-CoA transferase
VAEFVDHPQLHARHRWRPVDTPNGPVEVLLPPVCAGWAAPTGGVPRLGEHTASVLAWLREAGMPAADDPPPLPARAGRTTA